VIRSVLMWAARTAGSTPIRSITSTAEPRMSIGYPPPRSASAFSTTVTAKPYRCSQ
jgi:hypothetical protein